MSDILWQHVTALTAQLAKQETAIVILQSQVKELSETLTRRNAQATKEAFAQIANATAKENK